MDTGGTKKCVRTGVEGTKGRQGGKKDALGLEPLSLGQWTLREDLGRESSCSGGGGGCRDRRVKGAGS